MRIEKITWIMGTQMIARLPGVGDRKPCVHQDPLRRDHHAPHQELDDGLALAIGQRLDPRPNFLREHHHIRQAGAVLLGLGAFHVQLLHQRLDPLPFGLELRHLRGHDVVRDQALLKLHGEPGHVLADGRQASLVAGQSLRGVERSRRGRPPRQFGGQERRFPQGGRHQRPDLFVEPPRVGIARDTEAAAIHPRSMGAAAAAVDAAVPVLEIDTRHAAPTVPAQHQPAQEVEPLDIAGCPGPVVAQPRLRRLPHPLVHNRRDRHPDPLRRRAFADRGGDPAPAPRDLPLLGHHGTVSKLGKGALGRGVREPVPDDRRLLHMPAGGGGNA